MREIGVLEAKTHFSALVEAVENGGEAVIITRHGRPAARLMALEPQRPRELSAAVIAENFRRLREQIAVDAPSGQDPTWEELKEAMRR